MGTINTIRDYLQDLLPHPPRPDLVFGAPLRFVRLAGIWTERSRQRRHLAALDDQRLDDIGVTREQARREYRKPFWRV